MGFGAHVEEALQIEVFALGDGIRFHGGAGLLPYQSGCYNFILCPRKCYPENTEQKAKTSWA